MAFALTENTNCTFPGPFETYFLHNHRGYVYENNTTEAFDWGNKIMNKNGSSTSIWVLTFAQSLNFSEAQLCLQQLSENKATFS